MGACIGSESRGDDGGDDGGVDGPGPRVVSGTGWCGASVREYVSRTHNSGTVCTSCIYIYVCVC